ncbi:MAG: ASKHA domain-containing protein, partial [Clostridiales bacterium]
MRVTFLPNHIIQETPAGANLLDLISRAGIVIDGSCRGQGRCGCCRVQIVSGDAGMPDVAERKTLSAEDLAAGYRLACRVTVNDHLRVVLPNMTNADARKTRLVFMPEDFQPENGGPGLGAAFDIGTTTVVCMVWDLAEGRLVDIEAATNPQSVYGADVISRINYCGEATANLAQMQRLVTECFNGMLKQICRRSHLERQSIVQAVVVGNTTMSHLFLGANPATLAEAPFAPAFSGPQQRRAGDLGIEIAVDAPVLVLPNIAGHVGSDIVAGLMTSRLMDMPGCNVFIDMGTNGEVVLSDHGHSLACSTAAGPAFEGAAIFQGMRAASGAIEAVSIIDGVITL